MTRPKVFITRRWPEPVERQLAERYDVTLNENDVPLSRKELAATLATQDALCPTVTDLISANLLDGARAKIIANYGAGFNHIDIEACKRARIVVTNTPDVLTDATADLAMMLILMAARRAGEGEREIRAGKWTGWRPTHMMGAQVTGKTLGIVGFGRIGRAVAHKAHRGFDMKILYHTKSPEHDRTEAELNAGYCADLRDLLRQSDFVSLHCPGGAANHHLIDQAMLACMKPTAFLINTSRGEVVDEAALIAALDSGTIAGAGLDVYEQEPRISPALAKLENVVLLPHLGSATAETRIAMGMRVADNLDDFFAGRPPRDRIA